MAECLIKRRYNDGDIPTIVSWQNGTDDEIAAMIAAADAGQIDLTDYWSIGDERTVSLSAMAATGVGETHAAQSVTFVLMDTGANSGYKDANDKTVNFVVGLKHSLNENGYMNRTNTNAGSWESCARRTWCNNVFRMAIPETLRGIFKQFKTVTASENNSDTLKTSLDYFALFAEKEVFGTNTYSRAAEANALKQIKYYEVSANRIKNVNGSAAIWWERSPSSNYSYNFCIVNIYGNAGSNFASDAGGVASFGCI